jgi:hypothetical protein
MYAKFNQENCRNDGMIRALSLICGCSQWKASCTTTHNFDYPLDTFISSALPPLGKFVSPIQHLLLLGKMSQTLWHLLTLPRRCKSS